MSPHFLSLSKKAKNPPKYIVKVRRRRGKQVLAGKLISQNLIVMQRRFNLSFRGLQSLKREEKEKQIKKEHKKYEI